MELQEIYMETPPEHIAYIKFIFESYEEIGIIRTVDRNKAIIVLLAVADYVEVARQLVASLMTEVPLTEIPRPADLSDDWLMIELATNSNVLNKTAPE
jgi:hypothetical protein